VERRARGEGLAGGTLRRNDGDRSLLDAAQQCERCRLADPFLGASRAQLDRAQAQPVVAGQQASTEG